MLVEAYVTLAVYLMNAGRYAEFSTRYRTLVEKRLEDKKNQQVWAARNAAKMCEYERKSDEFASRMQAERKAHRLKLEAQIGRAVVRYLCTMCITSWSHMLLTQTHANL